VSHASRTSIATGCDAAIDHATFTAFPASFWWSEGEDSASLTRARVEAVEGHDGPQRLEGVGALVLSRRD
jgi:hypothetical protein